MNRKRPQPSMPSDPRGSGPRSEDMPMDTMLPVSGATVSEDAKHSAFGAPIPAEDISSNMLKKFGIGSGDGGPGGHV